MRARAILYSLIIGIGFVCVFVILTQVQAAILSAAGSEPSPSEAPLNPNGAAYEVNIDVLGHLWISDFDAYEIWRVNPTNRTYTVFQGIQAPIDARRDASGYVWWSDGLEGRFARMNPATGEASWWSAPNALSLYGTQVDEAGDFWATAWVEPYLYRYDDDASELCVYTVPVTGTVDYPISGGGYIWLGDKANGRILRLDPDANQFTAWDWEPPVGSSPEGAAYDSQGRLWWADSGLGQISRFWPDSGRVDNFDLPAGSLPQMVSHNGDDIWYSELYDGVIGRLQPTLAASTPSTLTMRSPTPAVPECNQVSPLFTETISSVTRTLTLTDVSYPTLVDSTGWKLFELPAGSFPWGVATAPDATWFVDNGRQVLGRIPLEQPPDPASVAACKVEDADGDQITTDDQTLLQNWPIDLRVDGVAQGVTQTTGLDGCVAWDGLEPGPAYGIQEGLPDGWTALTPTSHDFGPAVSGGVYTHTFVNTQQVSVTACKVEDEDGDPSTTDDQTPLENWAMDLRIDGAAQGITQTTGLDGCKSWEGLEPGPAYGVQEALPQGWIALAGTSHDFGPAVSGAAYSYTFINKQEGDSFIYLPLLSN